VACYSLVTSVAKAVTALVVVNAAVLAAHFSRLRFPLDQVTCGHGSRRTRRYRLL